MVKQCRDLDPGPKGPVNGRRRRRGASGGHGGCGGSYCCCFCCCGGGAEAVVGGRGRLRWVVVVKVSDFLKQQKGAAPAGGGVVLSWFCQGLGQNFLTRWAKLAAVVELSVKSRKMVTITFASKEGYSRDNKREIYASANARKAGLFVGHQYPFLELDAVTPLGHFENLWSAYNQSLLFEVYETQVVWWLK